MVSDQGRLVITREQLEELSREYEELNAIINTLTQNIAVIDATLRDYGNAKSVLETMSKGQIDDSFVSIGAGAFVKATTQVNTPILMSVGAGYVAEMEIQRAISMLDDRLKETQAIKSKLEEQLAEAMRRSNEVRNVLTIIYQQLQSQGRQPQAKS
ncbi:MAG: hypothetical protein AT710_01595 [Thermocladium sp. ECH_B]|jgi:prefoldin alpha subunit|nr:MAG: hypothetical protein AT710_01595 [Thermocladium sp. ECH_B]